jgi:hypothetical protein
MNKIETYKIIKEARIGLFNHKNNNDMLEFKDKNY